jgi:Ulp1 family protease
MNVDEFWNVGEYKFKKVKWWKRNNLFEMKKKIFIPINVSNYHWVLVVIDIEKKKIQHYDSIQRSETSTEITESNKAKKDWIIY